MGAALATAVLPLPTVVDPPVVGLLPLQFNQRGIYRWVAVPGGDLILPLDTQAFELSLNYPTFAFAGIDNVT